MPKLIGLVLAVALAGTASAAGWRSLRVDASSEVAFEQSVAELTDELNAARRYVFVEALKDIWIAGNEAAAAEQREFTEADYYRALDGLTYEDVIDFTDPTGETARDRYRAAMAASVRRPTFSGQAPNWGARPAAGWGSGGRLTGPSLQQ